jgi:hypothetical protein
MASSSSSSAAAHPKILEEIVEAGKKAFDPKNDAGTRASGLQAYDRLIERRAITLFRDHLFNIKALTDSKNTSLETLACSKHTH